MLNSLETNNTANCIQLEVKSERLDNLFYQIRVDLLGCLTQN